MRTHVGLLSGVNVGRHNQLAMADLRAIAVDLGLRDVATYIRSGNVVFDCCGREVDELTSELERAIAERSQARTQVVVRSRAELVAVVAANPYPDETDATKLHVVFHREPMGPAAAGAVQAAVERARARDSRDEAVVRGRELYLRVPDGLGRSVLAVELNRPRAVGGGAVATSRNWATVTRLLALLDTEVGQAR